MSCIHVLSYMWPCWYVCMKISVLLQWSLCVIDTITHEYSITVAALVSLLLANFNKRIYSALCMDIHIQNKHHSGVSYMYVHRCIMYLQHSKHTHIYTLTICARIRFFYLTYETYCGNCVTNACTSMDSISL